MSRWLSSDRQVRAGVLRILEVVSTGAVILLMSLIVANIISRSLFNLPLPNTNETSTYWLLLPVIFFGFIVAQSRGEHIEATLIYDRLGEQSKRYFQILGRVVASITCLLFAWFTALESLYAMEIGLKAQTSSLVIWPVTFVVPFGFTVLALQFVVQAFLVFRTGDPAAGTMRGRAEASSNEEGVST